MTSIDRNGIRAAQDTDLYALWVLMATTGVRVGEASV